MDNTDKKLLTLIQEGLSIESRPFKKVADELNITERETIERIKVLKSEGYIRRIGGVFDSKKLGYVSTLCAISVPEHKINKTKDIINRYDEITHNYIREDYYNMWFTIIASDEYRIKEIINEIINDTNIKELINLPSSKLFKIKAVLDLGGIKNA